MNPTFQLSDEEGRKQSAFPPRNGKGRTSPFVFFAFFFSSVSPSLFLLSLIPSQCKKKKENFPFLLSLKAKMQPISTFSDESSFQRDEKRRGEREGNCNLPLFFFLPSSSTNLQINTFPLLHFFLRKKVRQDRGSFFLIENAFLVGRVFPGNRPRGNNGLRNLSPIFDAVGSDLSSSCTLS